MSPEEVGSLEDRVVTDPEDLEARGRLLEHYWQAGDAGEWGRHELWLVEHHPVSELHRAPAGLSAALIEKLSVAWRKAVESAEAPGAALRNAALFFAGVDGQTSLELLTRARIAAPHDNQVFHLLFEVYVAQGPVFVERALVELENGQDAEMMWVVGRRLGTGPRSERLIERAKELDPEVAEKPERPRRAAGGGAGAKPVLIFKVKPEYPAAAREAGITGVVKFSVVVDAAGRVAGIQLESGHPLLVESALAAVKKWRYKPTLVNGVAVEVTTQVAVAFTAPR
jgi:TonB family protein